jgi:NitT/TauT family transport system permease protein
VDKLVTPLLVLSQGIPKIALAPVLLAWFGFGFKSNLAIGFLIAVFPVVVNTVLGLRSVDPALLRMGTSFGGAGLRLFRQVRLPAALPSIQAGMEIAVTFAAVGAIIGEFAAGSAGLGYLIQVTVGNLDMALGFAAIVCTALAGWITYLLVKAIGFILLRKQRAPR